MDDKTRFSVLQTSYKLGDYIVRQGAGGDTFFIISQGRVSCFVSFSCFLVDCTMTIFPILSAQFILVPDHNRYSVPYNFSILEKSTYQNINVKSKH